MAAACLFYYITDRTQFPGDEPARRRALLSKIAEAARAGVDYVQLREKDLGARELEILAREAVGAARENSLITNHQTQTTRLLINSRIDVAIAHRAVGAFHPDRAEIDVHAGERDRQPRERRVRAARCTRLPHLR